jgi:hypothetical protein
MPRCDSSVTCTRAVRLWPSPADLLPGGAAGVSEVSRFSCMKFLGVSGVFDYAGLSRSSRYRSCSCCLPRITRTSASGLHLFRAQYPPRLSSVYASLSPSRYQRKTRGQDGFATSFPVGLLHPLQHAGLARRTRVARHPGTIRQSDETHHISSQSTIRPLTGRSSFASPDS